MASRPSLFCWKSALPADMNIVGCVQNMREPGGPRKFALPISYTAAPLSARVATGHLSVGKAQKSELMVMESSVGSCSRVLESLEAAEAPTFGVCSTSDQNTRRRGRKSDSVPTQTMWLLAAVCVSMRAFQDENRRPRNFHLFSFVFRKFFGTCASKPLSGTGHNKTNGALARRDLSCTKTVRRRHSELEAKKGNLQCTAEHRVEVPTGQQNVKSQCQASRSWQLMERQGASPSTAGVFRFFFWFRAGSQSFLSVPEIS